MLGCLPPNLPPHPLPSPSLSHPHALPISVVRRLLLITYISTHPFMILCRNLLHKFFQLFLDSGVVQTRVFGFFGLYYSVLSQSRQNVVDELIYRQLLAENTVQVIFDGTVI